MRLGKDNHGQMSIDFLIGTTIFILAFIFLMVALPKMFTPFQSDSDQLTMIADRVAVKLVESDLVATDNAGQPLPCVLDSAKINNLKNTLSDAAGNEKTDQAELNERTALGLSKGDPSNPSDIYHVQIEVDEYDPTITPIGTFPAIFPTYPTNAQMGSQNVGQSRRFVYIRNMVPVAGDYAKNWPGDRAILVVRVW